MRILHILDHSLPLHSGYTFRTCAILAAQRSLGWETFHITSSKQRGATQSEERVDGYDFFRTLPWRSPLAHLPVAGQFGVMLTLERRLEQVVNQVNPDILHAHSPVLNAIPTLRVGRRHGIPVVYEVRAFWEDAAADHGTARPGGIRYRLSRALETYALRRADAVTVICNGLREDILARGIAREKVTVIPNAVDLNRFTTRTKRDLELMHHWGLAGKRVLGFIGSFYAYEGLPLLLQAFPRVLDDAPEARILLVGGGPDETRLRRTAKELGIADKVVFAGRVPHSDVPRYYDMVDLFIYPRYSMRLTELVTPLKPLEAMAQGRLVIASNVGGHRELIRDGVTGVLFASGDAEDLAEKIIALLGNPERAKAMREAARRFVENERTWTASVGRYHDVYAAVRRLRQRRI